MNKKEIKKAAIQKISEGKSRQETFEELKEENNTVKAEDIAKTLRFIPSLETRKKHKIPHNILLILLVITVVSKLLMGVSFILDKGTAWLPVLLIFPLINFYFLYSISRFQGESYKFVAIFTILGLTRSLQDILGAPIQTLVIIELLLLAGLIGLGFYLHSVMTPEYKTVKEKYTNQQGQERLRNKIKFMD